VVAGRGQRIGHRHRWKGPNGPIRAGTADSGRSALVPELGSGDACQGGLQESGYVQKELSSGTFERSFSTPTAIRTDEAEAVFKDGLLTLTLPKSEAVKPQHVKVIAG
jgi:hypothetical protein